MAVESKNNRQQFIGNGSAKIFPLNFVVYEEDWIKVFVGEGASEEEIFSGFHVDGAGTDSVSLVMHMAPATGVVLTVVRKLPLVQKEKIENTGAFNAKMLEGQFDRVVMMVQQISEEVDRSVKFPVSVEPPYPDSVDYLNEVKAWADDARASADRAAALSDPGALASGIYNIRKAWVITEAVASGEVLELPGVYFPKRNVLTLYYEGVVCSPRGPLVEASAQYQYEEIGDDLNVPSNQVRLFFDAQLGDVFDMQVTHSGLSGEIESISGLVDAAEEAAGDAARDAARAEEAAGEIKNITAVATSLTPETEATADYNAATGVLSLGIPKGRNGEPGKDGSGVNILDAFDDVSDLPAGGNPGDGYLVGEDLYIWSAADGGWKNAGPIRGPVGNTGPQGDKGDKGDKSTDLIPSGCIVLWSGSVTNIPSGWVLCDGYSGTPNLVSRFVLGAANPAAEMPNPPTPHQIGGAAAISLPVSGTVSATTLTAAHLPAHDHAIEERVGSGSGIAGNTLSSTTRSTSSSWQAPAQTLTRIGVSGASNPHGHTLSGTAAGTVLPPYYALAYIMKL